MTTRPAAVAGAFYPSDANVLRTDISRFMAGAEPAAQPDLKALIVPHAGYIYSGPIAASAYRLLEAHRERIRRVVLVGPAHRVYLTGMAFPSVDAFETPLGEVPIDTDAIEQALSLPATGISDEAHALEHCLEVHLPFLQTLLSDFQLIPIVVGECPADAVARVLEHFWDDETFILVSSDLSHFHTYEAAQQLDAETTNKIVARQDGLHGEEACGAHAINGLMRLARAHDLSVSVLVVRNSGDTAGNRSRVVGYGAYALH